MSKAGSSERTMKWQKKRLEAGLCMVCGQPRGEVGRNKPGRPRKDQPFVPKATPQLCVVCNGKRQQRDAARREQARKKKTKETLDE